MSQQCIDRSADAQAPAYVRWLGDAVQYMLLTLSIWPIWSLLSAGLNSGEQRDRGRLG